jgi:hypothetical protein
MAIHEELSVGQPIYRTDARTGEIVLRWYYYHPEPPAGELPEQIWFSKRFDPRQYFTKEELWRQYRLKPEHHGLPYQQCADWRDTHGHWNTRYWYARERVEAILKGKTKQAPQLELFE